MLDKKLFKGIVSVTIALAMMSMLLAGCGGNAKNAASSASTGSQQESTMKVETTSENQPLLEYSFFDSVNAAVQDYYSNPNDVVTPYIEKKFNIKVKDIITNTGGQRPEEKFNLLVASNTVPDVVMVDNPNLAKFFDSDRFVSLDEYVGSLDNINKYTSKIGWNMLKNKEGNIIGLPNSTPFKSDPVLAPNIIDDGIAYQGQTSMGLIVREDILKQLGYKFKTVKELEDDLTNNPRSLTTDDIQLEPKIETVADFDSLLRKIKALNLKIGDKDLIPLDMMNWTVYHFSTLFNSPGWMRDPSGNVTGFIDNPGMKDYYKLVNSWYRDGILDKDYVIQKNEQYLEKVYSGRVAAFCYCDSWSKAREALKKVNAEYEFRPIPWPEAAVGNTYVDASYPSGYYNTMISKNVKDIPRLLKYFDWFYSDEAMDIMSWGPEEAGLYEVKDGKKFFKDTKFAEAIASGQKTEDGKTASYYGLYDPYFSNGWTNKATRCAVGMYLYNPKTWQETYPGKIDYFEKIRRASADVKVCTDGTHAAPFGTNASEAGNWFWGDFITTKVAKLLTADAQADFDKAWDSTLKEFKSDKYVAAQKDMTDYFTMINGGK